MIRYESRFSSELEHSGIPGMKWGERNGPPYPLSRKDHMQVVKSSKDEAKKLKDKAKADKAKAKAVKKAAKKAKKAEAYRIKVEKKAKEQQEAIKKARAERDKNFEKTRSSGDSMELTNEELIERTNRLKLEDSYKLYMEKARGKSKGIVRTALNEAASTAVKTAATAALVFAGKQAISAILGAEPGWKGSGEGGSDDKKAKYKDIFGGGGKK